MKTLRRTAGHLPRAALAAALLAGVVLLAFAPAKADVIYNNGAPLTEGGGDWSSFGMQQLADDFMLLPDANVISDIHWWGFYPGNDPVPDDFTIRIFESVWGEPLPGPLFEINAGGANREATGVDAGGFDLFAYSVDIAPLALPPDVQYFLSVVNAVPWYWALSDIDWGNEFERWYDGTPWYPGLPHDAAFYLTDGETHAVPEPATLLLLGAGLMGVGIARRRFKS